jgi:type II secretory pathway pseudopilin PulG
MSPTSERGFSIIETLVACAILSFLLTGLYLLLVGGMRYYQQAQSYRTAQQDALVAMRALCEDMQDSRASCVMRDNAAADPYVIFVSAQRPYPNNAGPIQHDPSGQVSWQKWVCYYLDKTAPGAGELHRTEQSFAPTTSPPAIPAFATFPMGGAVNKVIARGLADMDIEIAGAVVDVSLQSRQMYSDRATEINLRSKLYLQN